MRRSQGIGDALENRNEESAGKTGFFGKIGLDDQSAPGGTIWENLTTLPGEEAVFPESLKMRVLPQRIVLFTALDAALLREATPSEEEATASELKVSISDHLVNRVQKGFVFIDEADDDLEEAEKAERESIRRYTATGSDLLTTEADFYTSWHSSFFVVSKSSVVTKNGNIGGGGRRVTIFPCL